MADAQSFGQPYASSEFLKQQQQQNLDFFSYIGPTDVLAPHPDLFESDIDSNLAAFSDHLQLLTVDSNDAYSFFRHENSQWQGPPSTITVSSESYDSLSTVSDSFQSDSLSSISPPTSDEVFDFNNLDMDFQRVRVGSEYAAVQPSLNLLDANDAASYGALPPTPPRSPPVQFAASRTFDKPYVPRSSFSDYGPPRRSSVASSDYYPHLGFTPSHTSHPTVSPTHISSTLPSVTSAGSVVSDDGKDPRKKYRCPTCPRAFARAYNLKTHMATHDPNRLKPHVCPQRSCGRSFSRKHDLGRHLISIHRDECGGSMLLPMMAKKHTIGVENGTRGWCDTCGKGWVGRSPVCQCADIK